MSLEDHALSAEPSAKELAAYDLNDFGNALRLIRIMGGHIDKDTVKPDIKRCRLLNLVGQGWIAFNGKHWDITFGDQLARQSAHMVSQRMRDPEVMTAIMDKHGRAPADIQRYLDSLGQAGSTAAMLKQAEPYLSIEIEEFDRAPMAFNVRNGTVWLRQTEKGLKADLRPHDPGDRITRIANTEYDPKAKAPQFEQLVATSLRNPEVRAFMQRACGYAFTGEIFEQGFFILQGKGADGKSTIMNALRDMAGGYGASAKVETFLDTGQASPNGPQPELVRLAGETRLVLLAEPPRGAKLNEGLIKGWTGGDPYSARQIQGKNFEFVPKGRLWMMCNALPVVKGDDDGIWRRMNVIMFEHQVPEDQRDKRLPEKLKAEFPGILNWIIAGVGDWLEQGLKPPEKVRAVLENYRKTSSPFGDWLDESCVYGEAAGDAVTGATVLYNSYKAWAEENGHDRPMSVRAFGDALMQRQILLGPRLSDGKKTRKPIRLKTLAETGPRPTANSFSQAPAGAQSDPFSMDGFE
ncbi:DNA primase family protein [Asticcacaulis excentricus]|uniref:Phage/plasmid primase, P4 family n=1 Tax=Asticcacaulis excentricus (strain ATCC 15261 / DSM 4724 / KCTC 12464 / NCIMB 9791 / VKM B-1370 / CB 48) TaxID=573065 RepID=E8RPP5_ASTEC|nr:phage/plasmid primase, P4 family [Asticcacaulis excentricus]ADU12022.1 phage/plasmid primase, P4 family [Asticcacaulis excentricus CB 48]